MDAELNNLIETAKKLAFLTETLERRSAAALQAQEQAGQNLVQTVAAVRQDVSGLIHGSGQQVAQGAQQSIDSALNPLMSRLEHSVEATIRRLTSSVQSFEDTASTSRRVMGRHAKMSFVYIVGLYVLLTLGGFTVLWLQWQSYNDARARAEAAQVNADLAEAYARVGMTSCGGHPCIKIDSKSQKWGGHGEYILVDEKK